MHCTTNPVPPELVLRHARGIRAAVRELISDPHRIEDITQETWLRAVERPPDDSAALGAWLRRVAKRLALRTRLRESRRPLHEARAATAQASAPAAGDVATLELLRAEVSAAVEDLLEPYRSAILDRYFRDLSAAEIARQHRVPVETVRTRLKRGLCRLRQRLRTDSWSIEEREQPFEQRNLRRQ